MHATPEMSGPSQCPLAAIRLHQVPKSAASGCDDSDALGSGAVRLSAVFTAFRRVAFSSRVPSFDLSHSLAFDSLTPCEVGDILRCGCYPCFIQAESEPPGRRPPAPGSYIHRFFPLPVKALWSDEFSWSFLDFRRFPSSRFNLADPSVVDIGLTTLLSIAVSRCRPAASSVCTLPLSLRAGKYPLAACHPAPGSYCGTEIDRSKPVSRLSADNFPRCVSGFRCQAFTSRFSGAA